MRSTTPLAAMLCAALLLAACNREPAATAQAPAAKPAPAAAPAVPMDTQTVGAPAPVPVPESQEIATVAADSGKSFSELDANGDGALTIDELPATEMLNQHFVIADNDGDGRLTPTEVDTHRSQMAAQ